MPRKRGLVFLLGGWYPNKKNCWSGPIENISILIFTKIKKIIIKKIKKNTWRYHYFIPVYQQSSWYNLQFLRYGVWQTEIGNYGSFFTLLPSPIKPQKIWILKKLKILLEISPFYTSVPKATIIWGTVPEIWSETAKILSFWAIF